MRLPLGRFDIVVEATYSTNVAIESLPLLGSDGVSCFLGVYREKEACQDFGKVITGMVLRNRLIFGSVSSDRVHFEMGIKDMVEIRRKCGGVLNRIITERLSLVDFKKAFSPGQTKIKAVINFK